MTKNTQGPSFKDWLEGARLRTLPLAVAPPALGAALGVATGGHRLWLAILCLVVALALQIGVNFANDYSDGIRGTDDDRVGPLRLTASGLVPAKVVRNVAFAFFGLAAAAGLWITIAAGAWWFLVVGAVCILAAWWYTGGKHPYGYAGLGEIMVFVFFGLVATLGTVYVVGGRVSDPVALVYACALGLLSAAVLMINNMRDIETDSVAGKHTLAVRMGRKVALWVYALMMLIPYVATVVVAFVADRWMLLGCAALPMHVFAWLLAKNPRNPKDEISALKLTSIGTLLFAIFIAVGVIAGFIATPNITHVGPLQ